MRRQRHKKPEKKKQQEIAYWRGELSKLKKLAEKLNKRIEELELSIGVEKNEKEERVYKGFREKFLDENYPK